MASPGVWVVAAGLVAFALKLCIALNTEGTNDVRFFQHFGRDLNLHGLEWTYRHWPIFNHPPLVAWYLRGIYLLSESPTLYANGLTFAFFLRLPGIMADLAVVLILLRLRDVWKLPTWSLVLLALSPVSLMVSGFHGNTDPVLVLLVVVAACLCLRDRPGWCGAVLALSCGIKIIPLLLLPLFFFHWYTRRRGLPFGLSFLGVLVAISLQPLLGFPLLFAKNVLGYGSYWGIWGISYGLRMTGWPGFSVIDYGKLPLPEILVSAVLKFGIVAAAFVIAWRRRKEDGQALFVSVAWTWLVFFILAPGVGAQYLVWLMPFVLVMSPVAFAGVTAASSCFLFVFYNTISGGLPWDLAFATDAVVERWAPWTLCPWLAFVAALVIAWQQSRASGMERVRARGDSNTRPSD